MPEESPASTKQQQPAATGGPRAARPLRRSSPKPSPQPAIPERTPAPERLVVGRIVGAHGLRGELHMVVITNHPDHLPKLKTVYLGEDFEPWQVRRIHTIPNGKEAIVRLVDHNSPEAAAERRGQLVWIDRADAPPLPEGEYYHYQLIGLDVVDESQNFLGRLAEIIETGANDVYVVRGPAGELLLPVIDGVILSVDPEGGQMVVRPPEYY